MNKCKALKSIIEGIDPQLENEAKIKNNVKTYINSTCNWKLSECKKIIGSYPIDTIYIKSKKMMLEWINL
jgi:hypothetical protein